MPLFDAALEQASTIGMEGASFITSTRRNQALRVAAQLGAGTTMDESTARLISRREGIRYVLAGAVDRNGSGYAISRQGHRPVRRQHGQHGHRERRRQGRSAQSCRLTGRAVRGALGDTTPTKDELADAETFTASSLEAMSAYARGQELNYAGRQTDALKAFEEAVALDPASLAPTPAWASFMAR